jgi:hypothetical protein
MHVVPLSDASGAHESNDIDADDEGESLGEEHEPPDGAGTLETVPEEDDIETDTMSVTPDTAVPHPLEGTQGGFTRSGRRIKVTARSRESQYQRSRKWVAWIAHALSPTELSIEDKIYEIFAHREYDIQDCASDPIAFSTTSDPDTMY